MTNDHLLVTLLSLLLHESGRLNKMRTNTWALVLELRQDDKGNKTSCVILHWRSGSYFYLSVTSMVAENHTRTILVWFSLYWNYRRWPSYLLRCVISVISCNKRYGWSPASVLTLVTWSHFSVSHYMNNHLFVLTTKDKFYYWSVGSLGNLVIFGYSLLEWHIL